MFLTPQDTTDLTRQAAETISRAWWLVLLNGIALIVIGVLIMSIDWGTQSLATFIGAIFVFEGAFTLVTPPLDGSSRAWNIFAGLAGIGAGAAIWIWPGPGVLVIGIFLGTWLLFTGAFEIVGSIMGRDVPGWWLVLILGLASVALGVLALRRPGETLAVIITVAGIWAAVVGVVRVVIAFQIKRLPKLVDELTRDAAPPRPPSTPTPAT